MWGVSVCVCVRAHTHTRFALMLAVGYIAGVHHGP